MDKQAGFTLVEVIASFVLAGLVAGLTAFLMSTGISGYLTTQQNTEASLKSHAALTRLSLEIKNLATLTSSTTTSLDFLNGAGGQRIVQYGGAGCPADAICLTDGDANLSGVLIDGVSVAAFTVNLADLDVDGDVDDINSIDVQFTMPLMQQNVVFQKQVYPRNQNLDLQTP